MNLTILTPAYNRADGILNLFQSLNRQTCMDFEWVIVDDGSTDNTQEVLTQIVKEAHFNIRHYYKENGGKHTALNDGLAYIHSDLTFIVDSDDCLTDDAVEAILSVHNRYAGKENICGYSFLRMFPDGQINGKQFVPNERIGTYIDVRINGDDTFADKAEVFLTKCLKEYPFPEFPNERFLGEDLVWIRMARKYNMVHINQAIYIGSYLENGLTKNRRKNNIKSPVGCYYRANEFMCKDIKLKYRIKGAVQYIVYGKYAGYGIGKMFKDSNSRALMCSSLIPGLILYHVWKRKY